MFPEFYPPEPIEAGEGIIHDRGLLVRAYRQWQETGVMPSREQIEAIDPQWEQDVMFVARFVASYREHMKPSKKG